MRKFHLYLLLPAFILVVNACGNKNANWPEPRIDEIVTDYEGKAVDGQPIQIVGANFSTRASDNKVYFGVGLDAVTAPVDIAEEGLLVLDAPAFGTKKVKVRVEVMGKESNYVDLEYIENPDPGPEPPGPTPETDFNPYKPTIDLAKMSGGSVTALVDSVDWIHYHGVWEGQWRNIDVIRARMNNHNSFGIFFDYKTEGRLYVNEKAEYVDALAGTNASMACCHYVRVNGDEKNGVHTADEYFTDNGALIKAKGVLDIRAANDAAASRFPQEVTDVGCGGPLLVMDGEIQTYPEENTATFLKTPHPRTAVGISKDAKTVLLVTVDGRWTVGATDSLAYGMNSRTLSKLMKGLGCYKALNLDGGGGTQMWIYKQGDLNNIVNHPHDDWPTYVDNKGPFYWIHQGKVARRTAGTLFYIKSDLKQ